MAHSDYRCQRRLNAHILLDHREARPPHPPHLRRRRNAHLRVHYRHRRHGRGRVQSRGLRPNHLHLLLHLLFCVNLGTCRLGRHRRDLPTPYPLQGRCALHRIQLVLELCHWLHHAIHG